MSGTQYIDYNKGLSRVRGNKKLYLRMLGLYLSSEEFDKLEKAIASGDYTSAGNLAHTIKGMSGNLSMDEVFTLSSQLVDQFRSGAPNPETIERYREALDQTLSQVEDLRSRLAAGDEIG